MPSIDRLNLAKRLLPLLILSVMSACVTDSTDHVLASSYCAVARPIGYDSLNDTPQTVLEIEVHNSQWACICDSDCPQR